ncbi:uncharacterized protein SCHCODRAFT_02488519 [Schizophyllum commune H4-8]|uniref:Fungal-type protein kinase domain-containing protein n=1 Tax=Schizophyllum commune (strain H4-8 / FGSC 9210) TaxID=578458 RepID=D8PKR8_SCHCM|nr:uncharacterized protein SCHCODRAFT_02488519 [Schizophyllum commune H4-8]KAI5897586.1 hypothetical protein SCHCODRAFT_02488519 [Schizophyllum commune H4-8]
MHIIPRPGDKHKCNVPEFYQAFIEQKGYKRLAPKTMARMMHLLCKCNSFDRRTGQWKSLRPHPQGGTDFRTMKDLLSDVLSVAAEVCPIRFFLAKRTTNFLFLPECQTTEEGPGTKFCVDAPSYSREAVPGTASNYIATVPRKSAAIYTGDVGVTWELRCWDHYSENDHSEYLILKSAEHMFFNDLRRMGHISVTFEGRTARIWCHTRAHSVVTERFDIDKNPEEFIQLILFTSFASPFQLGFDPTIHRIVVDGMVHYQFDVVLRDGTHHEYRSVSVEHEDSKARLYGRAMRVYKVVECGVENGPFHVVQDYWRFDDEYSSEEAKSQDAIFGALEKALPEDEFAAVRRHFMTILADGAVMHKNHDTHQTKALPHLNYRRRFRTVCKEHCETLHQVQDPATFFFGLSQLIYILDKLRRAGYLHRDISLGNVMLHCIDARATELSERYITKLADLELAIACDKVAKEDFSVGTRAFMAIEVHMRRHIFLGDPNEWKHLVVFQYFVPNPLHDLESALWLAVHFVYHHCSLRVLKNTPWETMRGYLDEIASYRESIFTAGTRERELFVLIAGSTFLPFREHMEQLYGPETVMLKLSSVLERLRRTYLAVEAERMSEEEIEQRMARDPRRVARRLSLAVFEEHAGLWDEARDVFREISEYFVKNSDSLVNISDIDFATGKIEGEEEAPMPEVAEDGPIDAENAPAVTADGPFIVDDAPTAEAALKKGKDAAQEDKATAEKLNFTQSTRKRKRNGEAEGGGKRKRSPQSLNPEIPRAAKVTRRSARLASRGPQV